MPKIKATTGITVQIIKLKTSTNFNVELNTSTYAIENGVKHFKKLKLSTDNANVTTKYSAKDNKIAVTTEYFLCANVAIAKLKTPA